MMKRTNLNNVQKESSFKKTLSWIRKKNNSLKLKYLKLTIILKKDWTVLLVQTLRHNTMVRR